MIKSVKIKLECKAGNAVALRYPEKLCKRRQ